MEKATNWELALINEIDDVLHDNYEDYETGIGLSDETKLEMAKEICDEFDWEDLRMTIMEKINEALKERLNYLRSLDNCTTLDPRGEEYAELCVLNDWERGDL